jgi:hypothetical protein
MEAFTKVTDRLSQRNLNRATLARQYLLERTPARAIDAIVFRFPRCCTQ